MAAVHRSSSWLGLNEDDEPGGNRLAPVESLPTADSGPDASERRIATIHLTSFHQARTVGERFRDGIPVIMDLSGMDEAGAKRVVDFASGLVFGLRGGMDRIAPRVFLVMPAGTELTRATRS
ncbi:MAG: cell division protein SepF [Actinocatenispora sp.]